MRTASYKLWSFLLNHCWFGSSKLNSVIAAECKYITHKHMQISMLDLHDDVLILKCTERVHTNTSYKCVIASSFLGGMSYHMATWTIQYHKRKKDETLFCPLKDKPFGFKKSLALGILSHHPDKNSQETPPHTTHLQEAKTSHLQPTSGNSCTTKGKKMRH